jgi:hypothetical protein
VAGAVLEDLEPEQQLALFRGIFTSSQLEQVVPMEILLLRPGIARHLVLWLCLLEVGLAEEKIPWERVGLAVGEPILNRLWLFLLICLGLLETLRLPLRLKGIMAALVGVTRGV